MKIIAHRGESYAAPENTLPAFKLAWARGVRWIELDIHLTRDNVVVVNHDADTSRIGDKKLVIAESTYQELLQVNVDIKKAKHWKNTRIPTLAEVIHAMPKGRGYGMLVEIKTSRASIIKYLKEILKESGRRNDQFVFMSFNAGLMAKVKKTFSDIESRLLVADIRDKTGRHKTSISQMISKMQRYGLDSIGPAWTMLDSQNISSFKQGGFSVNPWTTDHISVARKLVALGVDSITSNRAAWLKSRLEANNIRK